MSFAFVAYSTPQAYSTDRTWKAQIDQELQGPHWLLIGCVVRVSLQTRTEGVLWPPTPGLRLQLAMTLHDGVAFRHAQTLGASLPGSRGQQVPSFGANSIHCRRATHGQFILATFLPALARINTGFQHSISESLIRMLQHSIRGAWLTLTSAGVAPARQTDLASPHVHVMVICRLYHLARNVDGKESA